MNAWKSVLTDNDRTTGGSWQLVVSESTCSVKGPKFESHHGLDGHVYRDG